MNKRYFVDTNYFLRLLLKDNVEQSDEVYNFFSKAAKSKIQIFTSVVVFFECFWVLSSFYKHNKDQTIYYLEKIITLDFIELEHKPALTLALSLYKESTLSLEDCYHIYYAKQFVGSNIATFDQKLAKQFATVKELK